MPGQSFNYNFYKFISINKNIKIELNVMYKNMNYKIKLNETIIKGDIDEGQSYKINKYLIHIYI